MVGPSTVTEAPEVQVTEEETPEVVETPPVEEESVEDAPEDRTSLLKELFKGATVAELRAALDEVPPEVRTELEAEIERRGEQRARTREQEVQTASTSRRDVHEAAQKQGKRAEDWLEVQIRRIADGTLDTPPDAKQLAQAVDDYRAGGISALALESEKAIAPLLDTYLPDYKTNETLEKPLYQFGRTGDISKLLPVMLEQITEKAKAEGFEAGKAAAEQSKEAKLSLAEKAAKIVEVKQNSPGRINGAAVNHTSTRAKIAQMQQQLKQDLNNGKVEDYASRRGEIDVLIRSLPKE